MKEVMSNFSKIAIAGFNEDEFLTVCSHSVFELSKIVTLFNQRDTKVALWCNLKIIFFILEL